MVEGPNKLPRFILEADQRAAELGITRQQVLDADRAALRTYKLKPDCLDPDQISSLLGNPIMPTHEWVERQLAHIESCADCAALLWAGSNLKTESLDYLIGLIRGRSATESVWRRQAINVAEVNRLRLRRVTVRWMIIGTIGISIFAWQLHWPPLVWIVAVVAGLLLVALPLLSTAD